jgi:hypothetical protein
MNGGKSVPVHATKAYGVAQAESHSFLATILDEGERLASRPDHSSSRTHWIEAGWALRAGLGVMEKRKTLLLPLGVEPRFLGHLVRTPVTVGWDRVSRHATGWTVRGSNPGRKRDFPHPSRPALRPSLPLMQWVQDIFPGVYAAGAWRWPPTPPSVEVKERVEVYSPSGSSWPVPRRNLPLPLLLSLHRLGYPSSHEYTQQPA